MEECCENEIVHRRDPTSGDASTTSVSLGQNGSISPLITVFLEQGKNQSDNRSRFDRARCTCLELRFEAHNARLGERFTGSNVMMNGSITSVNSGWS